MVAMLSILHKKCSLKKYKPKLTIIHFLKSEKKINAKMTKFENHSQSILFFTNKPRSLFERVSLLPYVSKALAISVENSISYLYRIATFSVLMSQPPARLTKHFKHMFKNYSDLS